jgi:hypothetical protein
MKKNKTNKASQKEVTQAVVTLAQTHHDTVLALLIVSVLINLFILTGWVALQVTTVYDFEVASFLFSR